ncbi:MAG: tetratricopeptide repeat protein, partial [Chroococcales cyanobacterium]
MMRSHFFQRTPTDCAKFAILSMVAGIGLLLHASPLPAQTLQEQLQVPVFNETAGENRNDADFFLRLGSQSYHQGNLQKAIGYWLQALDLYHKVGDYEGISRTYEFLGLTYASLEQYDLAEDALRRRVGMARTREDLQGQIYALNNLGTLLLQRRSPMAAYEVFSDALRIALSVSNEEGEAISLSNLGLVATQSGNFLEAIKHHKAALVLHQRARDPISEANTYNNLGDAYRGVAEYDLAINSYQSARRIALDSRDPVNRLRAITGIARSYVAMGETEKALETLGDWNLVAREADDLRQELTAVTLAARLYLNAG